MKFKYELLFKNQENLLELKNELKKELKNQLVMMNKPSPNDKKMDKQLDDIAEKLSQMLTDKFKKGKGSKVAENNDSVDVFAELTSSLASLYGGIDPRVTGGQVIPVQGVIGNFAGQIDMSASPSGDVKSFMAGQNSVTPGQVDYTGKESLTVNNAISKGGLLGELEAVITSVLAPEPAHKPPTPFNTTPTPLK